jgi:hypothetical protein
MLLLLLETKLNERIDVKKFSSAQNTIYNYNK